MWRALRAIAGEISWQRLPHISLRFVTMPAWLHPNIYDVGFYRLTLIVLALLEDVATQRRGGAPCLTVRSRETGGARVSRASGGALPRGLWNASIALSRLCDRVFPPSRRRAVEWLCRRQEADGSFFSAVPMTALAAIALHRLDPVRHRARIDHAFAALQRWQIQGTTGTAQQFSDSTTWDTATSARLLLTLGVSPEDERVRRAVAWLRARQGRLRGDWAQRVPRVAAGGWGFQRHGAWYPDVDDTALVVRTLLAADPVGSLPAVRRGIGWILGMQNADGGFASWERNYRGWLRPPGLGPWVLQDVSCADITGRVCTALARVAADETGGLRDLQPQARSALRRAAAWLDRHRQGRAWFGLWCTHYVHGTAEVVRAYRAMGYPIEHPQIQDAAAWMLSVRNEDGGWGESPASARAGSFVRASSTAFHTATALQLLVLAGRSEHPAAERAARWLIEHQQPQGSWQDEAFHGVALPGLWYMRYGLVPTYTAAEALHAYREARR